MYIGSAGPARAGGRAEDRADGRKGRFEAQVPICIAKTKNAVKQHANTLWFLTFQITRNRKYRHLLFKTRLLGTAPDPGKMEHELRLATHQQRAGGKDDVSLNKLPQNRVVRGPFTSVAREFLRP